MGPDGPCPGPAGPPAPGSRCAGRLGAGGGGLLPVQCVVMFLVITAAYQKHSSF